MATLTTLLTLIRNSKTAVYYVFVILRFVPTAVSLLRKIVAVFGTEQMQAVMAALGNFADKNAPPAPSADNTGINPSNEKREKRRQAIRFINRLNLFGMLSDSEERVLAASHGVQLYTEGTECNMA